MGKDAHWMTGKVIGSEDLLHNSGDKDRSIKLVKIDISGNHVSYEPGVPRHASHHPVQAERSRNICFHVRGYSIRQQDANGSLLAESVESDRLETSCAQLLMYRFQAHMLIGF